MIELSTIQFNQGGNVAKFVSIPPRVPGHAITCSQVSISPKEKSLLREGPFFDHLGIHCA